MALTPGTRLGPYEIISPLGAGGMGEVYRAKDTRLDRLVAVKVVLGHVAANAEFRERFDREAKAISALDHPHICTLYDVGHEGDLDFLVMQFLEGETLADRLARGSRPFDSAQGKATSDPAKASTAPASEPAPDLATAISTISTMSRGPLPLDVTLRYAAEIASALDAAHRRNIVHRDLKPGNVMLTKSGTKLLDFGLAKLAQQSPVGGFGDMATRTSPLTGQGALLGTLHYMSPEQLEGRDVDSRSDIFAFGALLFEMLSGRRAFDGPNGSPASVIAAIIGTDPPPLGQLADVKTRLPLVAHAALERLLRKCLEKNPDDRWQSAADLADELKWINEERLRAAVPTDAPAAAAPVLPASRGRERVWMGVAAAAVIAAIAIGLWLYPRPAPPPEPISFLVEAPDGTDFAGGPGLLALSPDGRQVVFATGNQENRKLWVRPLGSLAASPLAGTEQAFQPVWSPDGQSILYTVGGSGAGLRRLDIAHGATTTIAPSAAERAAWGSRGVVLYSSLRSDGRLFSVPERGGPSTPVTELDKERREVQHLWPVFLPDGRRFVYLARSSDPTRNALYLASLDSPGRTHLLDVLSMAEYVPGFLLYQREGTLIAHPFDAEAGRLAGDPMPVLEDVIFNVGSGRAAFSVSATGAIVYRSAARQERVSALMWFDRTGKPVGQLGEPADYFRGALSPDGRRFVVSKWDGKVPSRTDLFMMDVDRGVPARFTSDAADERNPIWTPDSQTVVFTSNRKGPADLYVKAAGGATGERLLYESANTKQPTSISSDGRTLLFTQGSSPNARLWKLQMTGDPKPEQVFPGSTDEEGGAQFSPDGQWIAYTIAEGGKNTNVFVQRYPSNGIKTRVSTPTGSSPRWTSDGKHIVYQTDNNIFMSAAVAADGDRMRVDLPQVLFTRRQVLEARTSVFVMDKMAERFLLIVNPRQLAEGNLEPPPLTVVVNWAQTLGKR